MRCILIGVTSKWAQHSFPLHSALAVNMYFYVQHTSILRLMKCQKYYANESTTALLNSPASPSLA